MIEGSIQVDSGDNTKDESKMILAVRTDLKMGKGKIAAQCCHAVVSLYDMILNEKQSHGTLWRTQLKQWENTGAKKLITKVRTEREMYFNSILIGRNCLVQCHIRRYQNY